MKYLLTLFFCTSLVFCGSQNTYPLAENALDAGREFIDACLKGDFAKAQYYMLQDASNKQHLQTIETEYHLKDRDQRSQYREASINISGVEEVTENEVIVQYQNSYDKIGKKVKIIRQGNAWLVDFKYTFNPNL
jgi:hypothetical protein